MRPSAGEFQDVRYILAYLERHRALALVIALVYLAFTSWQHRIVNELILSLRQGRDTPAWDRSVALVLAPFVVAIAIWFVRLVVRHPARGLLLSYGALTIGLAILCNRVLMALNTELAHYFQYAILAVLIFPITGRLADTLIWTTLAGIFDESVQYWVHYRDWGIYHDLSDCIINLVGAAFGMLFVMAVRQERDDWPVASWRDVRRSAALRVTAIIASVCLLLVVTGRLVNVRPPGLDHWVIALNRGAPHQGFWTIVNYGRPIHVVRPWEFVIVIVLLALPYLALDKLAAQAMQRRHSERLVAPSTSLADA
jgi:hypothetical protein